MEQLNVGTKKTSMTNFYDELKSKLLVLSGILYPEVAEEANPDNKLFRDARQPILVLGKPGIGKTMGVISIIASINAYLEEIGKPQRLGFKKIQLGQTIVGDFSGIPVIKEDGTVIKKMSDDLPYEDKDGKYGVLFLDEITTADDAQIQPALGLADSSRQLQNYKLPSNWLVVAAGNGPDCANFKELKEATVNRFNIFDINYSWSDWAPYTRELSEYDNRPRIHQLVRAFLNFKPDYCSKPMTTEDDGEVGKQSPSPRSWEAVSNKLYSIEDANKQLSSLPANLRPNLEEIEPTNNRFCANIIGLIGTEAGESFIAYLAFKDSITKYDIKKIFEGKEKPMTSEEPQEVVTQVFEKVFDEARQECIDRNKEIDDLVAQGKMQEASTLQHTFLTHIANMTRWFINSDNLEFQSQFFAQIFSKVEQFVTISSDPEWQRIYCPEYAEYLVNHSDFFIDTYADLKSVYGGM